MYNTRNYPKEGYLYIKDQSVKRVASDKEVFEYKLISERDLFENYLYVDIK